MELVDGRARIDDVEAFLEGLAAVGDAHGCTLQAFDARYVAGRTHLERALALADRARERGEALARDRAVELLCYAAGRRQIERALAMGVDEGEGPVVVLVAVGRGDGAGEQPGREQARERERAAAAAVRDLDAVSADGSPIDSAADPDPLCEFFGIGERERRATDAGLEELVCERVALLDVEK